MELSEHADGGNYKHADGERRGVVPIGSCRRARGCFLKKGAGLAGLTAAVVLHRGGGCVRLHRRHDGGGTAGIDYRAQHAMAPDAVGTL